MAMNQVQLLAKDPLTGHKTLSYTYDVIECHKSFTSKPLTEKNRAMDKVSLCFFPVIHAALTDMQQDLPRSFIRSGHLT